MMRIGDLVIDGIEELTELVKGRNIMIEAPIGLINAAIELSRLLSERHSVGEVIVSGRNAWGACDLATPPPGFDLVHIGHALPRNVELLMRINGFTTEKGKITVINGKGFKTYVLPAYYIPNEDVVNSLSLRLSGYEGSMLLYPLLYKLYAESLARKIHGTAIGPFTGCFMPVKADRIIVVSGGYFYALTAKLINPGSRVLVADPHRLVVEDVEPVYRRYLGLKVNALMKAIEARRVAIVLTSKPGQGNIRHALDVKRRLMESGREAFIVYVDDATPDTLNSINADAIVVEACPRIALDDLDRVGKPLIAPLEVEYVIKGDINGYRISTTTIIPLTGIKGSH
jgi:2-(3-amino-3-carboxypropyl)histidine synthase